MLVLIPIAETAPENDQFLKNPLCAEITTASMDFYKRVGYNPPWICYFASQNGELVGSAGIKGKPVNGTVEIAYGTFEHLQNRGIGTLICRALVDLCLQHDKELRITARTLPVGKSSIRILEKNSFGFVGMVNDPEDGLVCEWIYQGNR